MIVSETILTQNVEHAYLIIYIPILQPKAATFTLRLHVRVSAGFSVSHRHSAWSLRK